MYTVLLTVVYLTLIWPLGWWERKRCGTSHPFHGWDITPPSLTTGWEALPEFTVQAVANRSMMSGSRSPVWLLLETLAFFARRGHYLLLPVLVLLLLLGLILFFVQSSVLAPFIYTIAVMPI